MCIAKVPVGLPVLSEGKSTSTSISSADESGDLVWEDWAVTSFNGDRDIPDKMRYTMNKYRINREFGVEILFNIILDSLSRK